MSKTHRTFAIQYNTMDIRQMQIAEIQKDIIPLFKDFESRDIMTIALKIDKSQKTVNDYIKGNSKTIVLTTLQAIAEVGMDILSLKIS